MPKERIIFIANSNSFKNSEQLIVKNPKNVKTHKISVEVSPNNFESRVAVFFEEGNNVILLVPEWNKAGLQHDQIKGYPSKYEGKWGLDKSVAIATHGYAITAHKSQGSEWDKVFVDYDMAGDKGRDPRWMYTAVTRGKNKVIMASRKDLPVKDYQEISSIIGLDKVEVKKVAKPIETAPPKKTTSKLGVVHIRAGNEDNKFDALVTSQVVEKTEGTTTRAGHKAVWFGDQDYEYVGSYHEAKEMPKPIKLKKN